MRLLTLLLAGVLLVGAASCKKDTPKRVLDANAAISIRLGDAGARSSEADPQKRLDLLKRITHIEGWWDKTSDSWAYGVDERDKDYNTLRIMMRGDAIINPETKTISRAFIGAWDVVLIDATLPGDTLAYIPNAVLREAEAKIMAAIEKEDYERVYQIFLDAYQGIPITGAEWRALKAEGKQ